MHSVQTPRRAYRAIEIFKGIDPALFPAPGNIQPFVLEQVAKAEPDVQALIAERIEAGEISRESARLCLPRRQTFHPGQRGPVILSPGERSSLSQVRRSLLRACRIFGEV